MHPSFLTLFFLWMLVTSTLARANVQHEFSTHLSQQPLTSGPDQGGNSFTAGRPLEKWIIPALRTGTDRSHTAYYTVNGLAAQKRDHFLELKNIATYMRLDTDRMNAMTFAAYARLVNFVNSRNNVFWITADLNKYKSTQVPLQQWITNNRMKAYLCAELEGPANKTLVHEAVSQLLADMQADVDLNIQFIGQRLVNMINLPQLRCP